MAMMIVLIATIVIIAFERAFHGSLCRLNKAEMPLVECLARHTRRSVVGCRPPFPARGQSTQSLLGGPGSVIETVISTPAATMTLAT